MSLLEKWVILTGLFWISAIAFILYARYMLARQHAVLKLIAERLGRLEKRLQVQQPEAPSDTTLTINKDEPLSKYQKVHLPDEINIHFVDS